MPDTPQTVLITGGTGSLGQALTAFLLTQTEATIRIYSRDELKQAQMRQRFGDARVRYFLGDVRDLARLHTALVGVDVVFHAAALKRIDQGEYDPEEFVKTNIGGTQNVIHACRTMGVHRAIFIGTDKAVCPINLYGASKLCAEKLWIRANAYAPHGTEYVAIRYGNVSGSRGSVIPLWRQQRAVGQAFTITDPAMTRFWITLEDAVALAWFAVHYAPRGSILVPHLPAYSVMTLMQAIAAETGASGEHVACQSVGIRPGEKLHEALLSADERQNVVVYATSTVQQVYYGVPPHAPSWPMPPIDAWAAPPGGQWQRESLADAYRSDTWPYRLAAREMQARLAGLGEAPC